MLKHNYGRFLSSWVLTLTGRETGQNYKLETIGDRAFQGCTGLEEIVIPEAVEKIGNEAFYGCTRLKHVTFPDSMVSIGVNVFFGCDSLDQETRDRLEELLSGV